MTALTIAAGAITVGLFAYLVFALVFPERLS